MLIAAAVLAVALAALLATHEWGLGVREDGAPRFGFLLEDVHDRTVYQKRGRWLPSGRTPYVDEPSEYPQLATWAFALPYLVIEHSVPRGLLRQGGGAERAQLAADRDAYFDAHHVLMAGALFALVAFTALGLRAVGGAPAHALWLLLPAGLYYGFNRFDAVPAALASLGVWLHLSGRRRASALALAAGAMTKWYPILLLPLCALTNVRADRAAARARGETLGWGPALTRGVLAPGALAAGFCLAVLAITFVWDGGGLDAVLAPYRHHAARGANPASAVMALTHPGRWDWFEPSARPTVGAVFSVLQFAPALLLALLPVRDPVALRWGLLTVVVGFVAFSKVFSPQWILWIAPLAVLLAPVARRAVVLAAGLDLLLYLQSPVLLHGSASRGPGGFVVSDAFLLACDVRIIWLFVFWGVCLVATVRASLAPGGRGEGPPAEAVPA